MSVDVVFVNAVWEKGYNRCGRWGGRTVSRSVNAPVYSLVCAGVLEKHGYSVKVVDALARGLSVDEMVFEVLGHNPKLVVVESNVASIGADLEAVKRFKTTLPSESRRVGLCGYMATADYKNLMRDNWFLDFCLIGEYDYTVLEMLKNPYWKHIDGLAYRDLFGVHVNKKTRFVENLDALPYPAYHLVDHSLYDELIYQKRPVIQSIESRGCPFSCSFCVSEGLFGCKWRSMSAERIVDEMEFWEGKGFRQVFWDGETFTVDKRRVFKVCELIKERGLSISWSCLGRADTVAPKMLDRMADAGCVYVRYGFESASQNILDFIQKGYKVKDIVNASKWTRDVGVLVHGAWMFVAPLETEESALRTIELAKQTCDTAQFTVCMPYPHTRYYDYCKENNLLLTEDWREYLASDQTVVKSDVDLGVLVERGYKEFYLRPSVVTKSLLRILRNGTFTKSLKNRVFLNRWLDSLVFTGLLSFYYLVWKLFV